MIQKQQAGAAPWLLLVHQLPVRPTNVRVKTWRRLQSLGAVAVKNSVYVLPNTPQAREDFEWVKTEIGAMGGQASVFAAQAADGAAGEEIEAAFRRARQQEYEAIRTAAEKLRTQARRGEAARRRARRTLRILQERLAQAEALDFFRAAGREEARGALDELEHQIADGQRAVREDRKGEVLMRGSYQKRTWVTRPRPGVDRMASAWLIRRFIDGRAKFRFAEKPPAGARVIPFDMYGVEFSHHGKHCTFETLLARFGLRRASLEPLARIVHQLDLKDESQPVAESAAVGRMIEGMRQMYADDDELLEQGIRMFEALYQSYAGRPEGKKKRR
jgi:hypothetical protein